MRFMSNYNIKIPAVLYERLKILAGKQGYSSAEEMINCANDQILAYGRG